MKIVLKTKHVIFFVVFCVLVYVAFKTYNFQKYSNKIEVRNEIPTVTLNTLLNKQLNVKYLKSFYYDNQCIGYNAILDNKYYLSVVKIGQADRKIDLMKLDKPYSEEDLISLPPIDVEEQIGRFMNFKNYPYKINAVNYYVKGKELDIMNMKFSEIIYNAKYINLSFNDIQKTYFIYSTPQEKMSLSFINYKNELYIINTKPYKNNSFIDLHTLIK